VSDAAAERALLQRLAAGPVGGDVLAREAGLTRAAVWKRVAALRAAGIAIAASPGRGYQLEQPLDLLDAAAIRVALAEPALSQLAALELAWSLDSTNSELLRRERLVCPYAPGSAEFDAFFAGADEGAGVAQLYLESLA